MAAGPLRSGSDFSRSAGIATSAGGWNSFPAALAVDSARWRRFPRSVGRRPASAAAVRTFRSYASVPPLKTANLDAPGWEYLASGAWPRSFLARCPLAPAAGPAPAACCRAGLFVPTGAGPRIPEVSRCPANAFKAMSWHDLEVEFEADLESVFLFAAVESENAMGGNLPDGLGEFEVILVLQPLPLGKLVALGGPILPVSHSSVRMSARTSAVSAIISARMCCTPARTSSTVASSFSGLTQVGSSSSRLGTAASRFHTARASGSRPRSRGRCWPVSSSWVCRAGRDLPAV